MSKETFYFPHDYDSTSDPKMQAFIGKYGGLGYGIFWRVVEMLHSNSDHKLPLKQYIFSAIAKQMLTSDEQMLEIIKYAIDYCELFESDQINFWSKRVDSNLKRRAEIAEKRSIAGRKGFEAKYGKQAIAKQRSANSSKGKEKKEKEKKEYSPEFLVFYSAYPKRVGRDAAWKAWKNRNGSLPEINIIIAAIQKQIKSPDWIKESGKYIPHPATWINQGRWADEPVFIEGDSRWK